MSPSQGVCWVFVCMPVSPVVGCGLRSATDVQVCPNEPCSSLAQCSRSPQVWVKSCGFPRLAHANWTKTTGCCTSLSGSLRAQRETSKKKFIIFAFRLELRCFNATCSQDARLSLGDLVQAQKISSFQDALFKLWHAENSHLKSKLHNRIILL